MKKGVLGIWFLAVALLLWGTADVMAKTKAGSKRNRIPQRVLQEQIPVFELGENQVSAIQFKLTNYGIFGLDVAAGAGGGFWPRGSNKQYIFGGGVWFAAMKKVQADTGIAFNKLCVISYNPNSGNSWMVPGSVKDGPKVREDLAKKYRLYFSPKFAPDGTPADPAAYENWPIWDTHPTLKAGECVDNSSGQSVFIPYYGSYVDDVTKRNLSTYPKGPVYISHEDIFCVYKDTDLSAYEGGAEEKARVGYPLGIDIQQMIHSWGCGDYADFIFIVYQVINQSDDTLYNCWLAPAMDMDITLRGVAGHANDRVSFYFWDTTLNLAYQWTNGDLGEEGKGFGYIGFDFMESPIVDENGFIVSRFANRLPKEGELGLKTFRNWVIANDPSTDKGRYDFVSAGVKEGDTEAGDKRFLMATGPFHMRPGDTARVVVGLIMALPATEQGLKTVPLGTQEDLANLVAKDKFAQEVYDQCFKTPKPPDPSFVTWEPLDNGVIVHWDSTAEVSYDDVEAGLDFMGYILYRARRTDLDTFDVDTRQPTKEYPKGRGPFGWKEIARWSVPPAFLKSAKYQVVPAGGCGDVPLMVDSIQILGVDPGDPFRIIVRRFKNPEWNWVWDQMSPEEVEYYLVDTIIVNRAKVGEAQLVNDNLDSVYSYIATQRIITYFPDIGDHPLARAFILKYMKETTQRMFADIGDDNRDGVVTETPDVRTTEKLINNIPYYYRLLAFDEGDILQGYWGLVNSGIIGQNIVRAIPQRPPVGFGVKPQVIIEDSSAMGGFYNFQMKVLNSERAYQLYGGKEFEIEFLPAVSGAITLTDRFVTDPRNVGTYGIYACDVVIRDAETGQELARYQTNLPANPAAPGSAVTAFCEHAYVWNFSDEFGMGEYDSQLKQGRGGTFTTNTPLYRPNQTLMGALEFTFDYYLQQWGGKLRPGDPWIEPANPDEAPDVRVEPTQDRKIQLVAGEYRVDGSMLRFQRYIRFNNGPAIYELEFTEGGIDTLTIETRQKTVTFTVPYLDVKVRNVARYKRPTPEGDTVLVEYGKELPHYEMSLPVQVPDPDSGLVWIDLGSRSQIGGPSDWPIPEAVPIGQWNLSAYGWLNPGSGDKLKDRRNQAANKDRGIPVGKQGRYYLTAVNGSDTVKFTHVFLASGTQFLLDFANKRGRKSNQRLIPKQDTIPTVDFRPGDKVYLPVYGGALGWPNPGFKVRIKLQADTVALQNYTSNVLDSVTVVPNPYIVAHLGQETPDLPKLYFTRLPKKCTIRIYTLDGELVRTIEHEDDPAQPGIQALAVWDLLSSWRQKAKSQAFFAVIETPNGEVGLVKFSIITGGFRNVAR